MARISYMLAALSALLAASAFNLPDTGLQQNEFRIHRSFRRTLERSVRSDEPCGADRDTREIHRMYAIFIDAGSSGSRAWVYTWLPTETDESGLPDAQSLGNMKVEPGLSSKADDEAAIKADIVKLVNFAKETVPACKHSETPIYMFATAGLRMLPEDKANRVIDLVYQTLTDKSVSPFIVYDRDSARILSGEEEGVFMWLAVNYLSDTLAKGESEDNTVGILELGGASTQIAFIPSGILLANKFALDLAENRYSLYVHSYLDYGQDRVLAFIQNYLIEKTPQNSTFENPCMLTGQTETASSQSGTTAFIGSSNPSECVKILEELVYKVSPGRCHPKPCAIGEAYQPTLPADKEFYVLGAFYHNLNNIKAVTEGQPINFDTVRKTATEFCSKSKAEVSAQYPKIPEKFITTSCVTSLYFNVLLQRGYGFPENSDKIMVRDKINGKSIDWTLGALMYERFTHPTHKESDSAEAVAAERQRIKSKLLEMIKALAQWQF